MSHEDNLKIVQLTIIRNLTPTQSIEWIKQHYPETSISISYYFKLKKELKETAPQQLFKTGQTLPETVNKVKDTIDDLQKLSYENYERAVADGDHKSAQFILNSIRDLQIWVLNINEKTKSVIEVHAKPKHNSTPSTTDNRISVTTPSE